MIKEAGHLKATSGPGSECSASRTKLRHFSGKLDRVYGLGGTNTLMSVS